ncbi:putative UDP-arabinose 4-epimerase 1 [Apostasia shenzhenica]|uniref:Putative UDP-arabinose 4-epimerase 1 n=1 Tax=Apostasia shenzhenica TaxID=1088818 RepID=A0A2I0B2D0_9ASPA|nr:putative UDP-arabinose 4-epimerase 1 [Apostasia shenzhenica]
MKEFVEACIKGTGIDINVEYLSRRAGDHAKVYGALAKIQRELNWTSQNTDPEEP